MLSDEEKKAVEILNKWLCKTHSEFCKVGAVGIPNEEFFATEIVLNLIEKQSKEIEELKEKDDANLAYYDQIYQNGIYTGQKAVEEKIKAKIEELKAIADNGANAVRFAMTHEDEIERIQKQKDIGTMVEILQSLLEKE